MELKGKKVNFLGDSITQGYAATKPEFMYHAVIKEQEGLAEARNYGISGTRIAMEDDKDTTAYVSRYVKMDDDADIIVVFGGTNDYGHGIAPLGEPGDRVGTTFYGAMNLLTEGLINKYPTATIIFLTPTPRSYPSHAADNTRSFCGATLKEYADIIKEVAASHSIPVLDLLAMYGCDPNIEAHRAAYMPDGLHPNDAGHAVLASKIIGFLKTL